MMKKYIMVFCLVAAIPAVAQETYENANIVTGDLNGNCRRVPANCRFTFKGASFIIL